MFSIKKIPTNSKLLLISLYLLTFINIASLGLPIFFDIIVTLLLLVFIKRNKLITLITNIILILLLIIVTLLLKNENSKSFYRGHEKFYKNENSYKANINQVLNIPHGDIIAVDTCLKNSNNLIEPREQVFITDNLGYRNSTIKIEDAELLLVGDSIVAGSGLSDENILSSQINNMSKFKTANISIGGADPVKYEAMILSHLKTINKSSKIFVFYFEGNDFKIFNKEKIPEYSYNDMKISKFKYKIRFAYERLERNKDKFFEKKLDYKNIFYIKIRPKSQRLFKRILLKWTNSCKVQYDFINNKLTGFLWTNRDKNYKYKTYIINNSKVLERIDKVFFVPTKASVYKEYAKNIINFKSNSNKNILFK